MLDKQPKTIEQILYTGIVIKTPALDNEEFLRLADERVLQAKQDLEQLILWVIGESEQRIPSETNNLQSKKRRIRNAVKSEQTNRLNQVIGKDTSK